jgi:RNA polymerase sigma-70 factor (ECF subfamily)
MKDADDLSCLNASAAGDKQALRQLYDRHYPGLFQFIRARLHDPVEATDVIQETFLAVWRQAQGYRSQASVKTWIYSIARNKAIDRQRSNRQEVTLDEAPEMPDGALQPDQVSEALSDARRVRECIDGLSPAHQRVIRLAFYEEAEYAEIAEIEQIPVGTVKTRIFHAKKLLLVCLGRSSRES